MTNKERFIELLRSTKREGIEKLIDFLEKTDFFTAPASTRFHSSYEGGLLQHSLNVYDCLAGLGTTTGDVQEFQTAGMRLDSIPQESIIIVALLHDLCKTNFYATEMRWRKDANQKWEQYPVYTVNDRNPYGHGEKSVMMASEFIHLTMEERYAIRWHMGMSEANIHPDILPGCREIPAGIIHAHGGPDGHKLPGDQHRKQETGRHLPRNGTGSAGSGRIRRGRAYLTGGQP